MKYFVITTKHHEGFCLWDSKLTDYKATNTPARRDLLKPMVEAFRNQGPASGFYYSLIDWHHPDFVIDPHIGPYREAPRPREAEPGPRHEPLRRVHARPGSRTAHRAIGPVDVMWFDFSYPKPDGSGKGRNDWESEKLYKLVRELAPNIILDDRLDLRGGWDIKTPEQFQPRELGEVQGHTGGLGSLPDLLRLLGLPPRRAHLAERG